jgi:hypothetical protein
VSYYLDTAQAAEHLNVCETTFRDHVAPHVACYPIGRKPLYRVEDLDEFMAARRTERAPKRRVASRRRGSAHSVVSTPKARELAAELEGGARGR